MTKVEEFKEFMNEIEKYFNFTTIKFMETLKNKSDKNIIATKENLSMQIAYNLLEDVKHILGLGTINSRKRYIDYILRGLVEHVIEYKYLIENEGLIAEYFGSEIEIDETKINSDEVNLIGELKKFGSRRYTKRRTKIIDMAKEIGEEISIDDDLALYDIFSITSEQSHNSYFQSYLDDSDYIEENQEVESLNDNHIMFMQVILVKFLESYKKIMS